ncbi:MAG TPA: TonB-dependent receptor [Methylomusa anaerophila]|uniref:Colicin I receptor n=1 Tax=Methylomusa anaerophila TaxID=1930071 RepID=A0A348AE99_9FIRM|nr:TonB-dependent receptor [Methylomusa anaerophila]BBB89397.1 colicin I receptor precursor [Methylomusa anaerophila]HML90474.1 TonB-dependent receptor [Methylomusa anaerophila]
MNKKWEHKSIALAITLGVALSPVNLAGAAADGEPTFDLDQVVVTATKTEKKVKDVPAAVEVITKEDMDKKNIKRVADALTTVPGVYVRQTKGLMGSTDSITMRGFGSQKQILILMDGQPINDGYNGGVNLANIPTENIDRIEVIKGPASALYGSNAMGGVINIITKEKARQETIVRLGIGGQETITRSIFTSGSAGKLDYFITAQGTSADGYEAYEDYKTAIPGSDRARNPGKNGMDRKLYDGKLVYHPDENSKISLSGGDNRFKYFSENVADRGVRNENIWALNYERKLSGDSSLKVSYGEKEIESWYVSTSYSSTTNNVSSYSYTRNPSKTSQAEVQYNFRAGAKDLLTIGYTYRSEQSDSLAKTLTVASQGWNLAAATANSDNNIGGKTETKSFFIQDEHKLGDNTTLYLGGRYDDWRFYDGYTYGYDSTRKSYVTNNTPEGKADSFNPKLGLVHKVNDKLTLRSSIGRAFRAPNIYELAKDWESSSGVIYKSNPGLQPEKDINYELGCDYQIDKTLLARLNIYHTEVTDAIDKRTSTNSAGRTVSQFINSGEARVNGLEFSLNKRWSDSWNSFLNYTYTDAKVTESIAAPENVGKQMAAVPKNMFNIGFNYAKGPWQGSLTGNYVSETNDPSKQGQTGYGTYEAYFTVDTKVSYKLSENTAVSLSIDNLFDRKHYIYYVAQPRTTYLELTHKF